MGSELNLYTIRHNNGVIAYVLATDCKSAVAAVGWDPDLCSVIFTNPVDGYVLDIDLAS